MKKKGGRWGWGWEWEWGWEWGWGWGWEWGIQKKSPPITAPPSWPDP